MSIFNPYVIRTGPSTATRMRLWSEQFQPTGSTDARVSKRAIGKSHISFWSLFLRESLQNSWDARLSRENGPIDFIVAAHTLDTERTAMLRKRVISSFPPDASTSSRLKEAFASDTLPVLTVTDRHTRGLGGPMRADKADPSSGATNFVDFVRNIGRATAKGYDGGTYGLGKGVLFMASAASTCVIYTQTRFDGELQPRLIAMCVSDDSFTYEEARYTGRHWWGVQDAGVVDPLVGPEARDLAIALGLTHLDAHETGTSVTILAPDLSHPNELEEGIDEVDDLIDTPEEVVRVIAHAAKKWAWPHMIDLGAGQSINFTFSVNGNAIELEHPALDNRYKEFVASYVQAVGQQESTNPAFMFPVAGQSIMAERYTGHKHFGTLAFIPDDRVQITNGEDASLIALMREPRFIVRYLPVQDSARYRFRGVFIADKQHDENFALSEPVAHDDWNPQNLQLPKGTRNPVKQTLDKIKAVFSTRVRNDSSAAEATSLSGVTAVARELGTLLSGALGFGAEVVVPTKTGPGLLPPPSTEVGGGSGAQGEGDNGSPATPSSRSRSAPKTFRVTVGDEPELFYRNGAIELEYEVRATVGPHFDASATTLVAEPHIMLDDGRTEKEAPLGAPIPEVAGWFVDGIQLSSSAQIALATIRGRVATVIVLPPPDTAISLHVGEVEN